MLERNTDKSIKQKFNQMLLYSMIMDAIMIVAGIVIVCVPDTSSKVIGIIVGIIFILNGAGMCYKYFQRNGAKLYSLNLMFGILAIILGLVLIFYPYTVMNFVTICLGIYLIISGALNINYGAWFKVGKEESWLLTVFIGILLIIFGILVMANPFASLSVTQVIGVFLIFLGILQITDTVLFKKRADDIMNIFW